VYVANDPTLIEPLLESQRQPPVDNAEPLIEPLTDREIEVLQLLAQGLANKQIAAELGISEHTVKFHVSGIYTRLGAASRTEAVRLGVRQGLIVL
jgi:DNA-binding NarL/FixJ family response regulator